MTDSVLKNKRVYLSSPMSAVENGFDWNVKRHEVKQNLREKFGLKVFDPYDDPKQLLLGEMRHSKNIGEINRVHEIAQDFVRIDLSVVDRADIIVAHLPAKVPTTGCVHEIINAYNAKKPVFLVEGTDHKLLSDWYRGFMKPYWFLSTFEELYQKLEDINNGAYPESRRLWFLRNYPKEWLE